ncbi:hypothetical protein M433DRAFT_1192 [Acidomyces richmondensis BFW]|nr:MAG: hypothetical protein FE78DRAFT_144237 [Acidomyces sp. 'richmondensis']KYG49399.1 hypothetical protein M433DRAFT_1192 [Acidomyces richmondensis BFW]
MEQPSPSAETESLLARLSQRPGVQSTLILSQETGAIVRTSGLYTADDLAGPDLTSASALVNGSTTAESDSQLQLQPSPQQQQKKKGTRNAEEVAKLVWNFMKGAGTLVEELNGYSDEAKLLRLRTKKNELVIVPDMRFLLVVIHDTPPA